MLNKLLVACFFTLCFNLSGFSQVNVVQLNSEKVTLYSPYMAARHGGTEGLEKFKTNNRYDYQREMWYFTESFYIKRNHLSTGITMDAGMIDITRYEQYRQADTDVTFELPGFKDAIVLIATNKLLFKPNF